MAPSPRLAQFPALALLASATLTVSSCCSVGAGTEEELDRLERPVRELKARADLLWRLTSGGDDMVLERTGYTTAEYVDDEGHPFIPEGYTPFPGGRARSAFLAWLAGREIRRDLAVVVTTCGGFRSPVPEADPGLLWKTEEEAIAALEKRLLDQGFARVVFTYDGCFRPERIIRDSAAPGGTVPSADQNSAESPFGPIPPPDAGAVLEGS